MKTTITLRKATKVLRTLFFISLIIILISSCVRGRDGRPGRAFLALDWEYVIPEYLDAGTPDIPPYFHWGHAYLAYPGFYTLYYEGTVHNGPTHVFYAWEIDYEIWIVQGEPGLYYTHGCDGPDSYFTIICNPYGPYTLNSTKITEADAVISIIEDTGDSIVVMMEKNEYRMKLTYRKVEPRSKPAVGSR